VRGVFFDSWREATISAGLGEHLLVDVAERDDLDRRNLDQPQQVALAIPAGADQPNPRPLVGKLLSVAIVPSQYRRGDGKPAP
jgi:hypothetical protein